MTARDVRQGRSSDQINCRQYESRLRSDPDRSIACAVTVVTSALYNLKEEPLLKRASKQLEIFSIGRLVIQEIQGPKLPNLVSRELAAR